MIIVFLNGFLFSKPKNNNKICFVFLKTKDNIFWKTFFSWQNNTYKTQLKILKID